MLIKRDHLLLLIKKTGKFHPRTNRNTWTEPRTGLDWLCATQRDILLHARHTIAILSGWLLFCRPSEYCLFCEKKKNRHTQAQKFAHSRRWSSIQCKFVTKSHFYTHTQRREKNPDWSRELLFKFRINWFSQPAASAREVRDALSQLWLSRCPVQKRKTRLWRWASYLAYLCANMYKNAVSVCDDMVSPLCCDALRVTINVYII